jgi:hypothetical protein
MAVVAPRSEVAVLGFLAARIALRSLAFYPVPVPRRPTRDLARRGRSLRKNRVGTRRRRLYHEQHETSP